MLWVISDVGVANILNAGGGDHLRLKITRFALGSASLYTPVSTMTSLQGSQVFSGSLITYTTQDNNTSVFKFVVPASEPEFDFGEMALYADVGSGEFLFALGVTDIENTKRLGTQIEFNIMLQYNKLSSSIVFLSSNSYNIPVLGSATMLPRLQDGSVAQYIIRHNDILNTNAAFLVY